LTYLTTLLQDNGYATVTAEDGVAGMKQVMSCKPDLITLDISMPEKSGLAFYRELRSDDTLAGIPVVVVTGVTGHGGRSDDFKKFLASRKNIPAPNAFVAKPIDQEELLKVISDLLS
jgi:CheY-like chemotaxis protein